MMSAQVRPTVVLIDDDAAVISSLRFALEMEGLSVAGYGRPSELLAGIDPLQTGCLVLDYGLPETNGLELLGILRGMGVSAPAIIITTNPGPALRRRAEAEGVAIVEKPLLGNTLIETIRASLTLWSR